MRPRPDGPLLNRLNFGTAIVGCERNDMDDGAAHGASAEWMEKRMSLIDSLRNRAVRLDCLAAEGFYDMLMDEVEAAGFSALERREGTLAERYPERVLAMHLKELKSNQTYPGNDRTAYRRFCERLAHVKKLPGGEAAVAQIVGEMRRTYPRRPALLDELSRV